MEQLGINTIMVEEGAEILEPHVIASLQHGTNRFISIGDHFQLRGKITSYVLQVRWPLGSMPCLCFFASWRSHGLFATVHTLLQLRTQPAVFGRLLLQIRRHIWCRR